MKYSKVVANKTRMFDLFILTGCFFVLFAEKEAIADGKFTYTPQELEYNWQSFTATPGQDSYQSFTADLNQDGATDLIITGATPPSESDVSRGPQYGLILFNNGDNTFTPAEGDVPGSVAARNVLVEDFNNDGILDIYIADSGYDAQPFPGFKNQLLLGTGTGFTDISNRLPDIEAFTHGAAAGDIDGDGDLDIISLNFDDVVEKLSYFLINDGEANFTVNRQRLPDSLVSTDQEILKQSFSAELADLDGDGMPDLVIGRAQDGRTRIHWNDGSGNYSDDMVTYLDDVDIWGVGIENVAVIRIKGIDVDGDGLRDLVLTSTDQGSFQGLSMQLYMNQGGRVFKDETIARLTDVVRQPDLQGPYRTQFADINNDGITDILSEGASSSGNTILLFEGDGEGCFTPITMDEVTTDPSVRYPLSLLPLVSPEGLGYAEVTGSFEGEDIIQIHAYVPLDIQALPTVANSYNACRGKIAVSLDFEGSLYALDFSIFATEPTPVIQAIESSVRVMTESTRDMATFNSADGRLILPELVIDGEVAFRNLVFQLTDGEQLLFSLESFESN